MKNVPPSVRAALKNRGADAILNQEGDYYDFKSQIDQIIHQGENQQPQELGDSTGVMDNFEEELSPQEQKATERIEQLGDKFGISESQLNEAQGTLKKYYKWATPKEILDQFDTIEEFQGLSDDVKNKLKAQVVEKGVADLTDEYSYKLLGESGVKERLADFEKSVPEELKDTFNKAVGKPNNNYEEDLDHWEAEDYNIEGLDDDIKTKPERPGMPDHHWEEPDDPEKERHIVIDEGPHKGERYDNPDDYKNSNNDRQAAIDKIKSISDRINATDADDINGYLTNEESDLIKKLAQEHKITSDELREIGGRMFSDNDYPADEYGWKEAKPETKAPVNNDDVREEDLNIISQYAGKIHQTRSKSTLEKYRKIIESSDASPKAKKILTDDIDNYIKLFGQYLGR